LSTIIAAFIIEILITRNELLYQWPVMLAAIPVVIAIYSFLTFVPKWAIEGEIQEKSNNNNSDVCNNHHYFSVHIC